MKPILLAIEAVILIVPISVVLIYTSLLTIVLGLPAAFMQVVDSSSAYDPFVPASAVGNISGVYAMIILWSLAWKTITSQPYTFSKSFWVGVSSGILASLCSVYIFGLMSLLYVAFPPILLAVHFFILQKGLGQNA